MDETSAAVPRSTADERALVKGLAADLPPDVRRLRVEVMEQTLALGVPVDPSALTIVLAAHLDAADEPLRFSPEHVSALLWHEIAGFCDDHGLTLRVECGPALHALLAVLVQREHLVDHIRELFAPFDELGSLAVAS